MRRMVFATNNAHKIREVKRFLQARGIAIELLTLGEAGFAGEIVEDAETFEGNACKKARTVRDATGMDTLADDSGLIVDVLDGAPGVYSARFSGAGATDARNNEKLLKLLRDVPNENRTARFYCAICMCRADGGEETVTGECAGTILSAPTDGVPFGYDPLFWYPPLGKSFAQMGEDEKNAVSHRGRALEKLAALLAAEETPRK